MQYSFVSVLLTVISSIALFPSTVRSSSLCNDGEVLIELLSTMPDIQSVMLNDENGNGVQHSSSNDNGKSWCLDSCGKYSIVHSNYLNYWTLYQDGEEIGSGMYTINAKVVICEEPSESPSHSQTSSASPSHCENESGWSINSLDLTCESAENLGSWVCEAFQSYTNFGKSINEACCICDGGGDHVVVAPSRMPSANPSLSSSSSPSILSSSEPSVSIVPSITPSVSPSNCEDDATWFVTTNNGFEVKCSHIPNHSYCETMNSLDSFHGESIYEACCICGGGDHVTISPSDNPSQTMSPTVVPSYHPTQCSDEYNWYTPGPMAYNCTIIAAHPDFFCTSFDPWGEYNGKTASDACCACGGGDQLIVEPSGIPSLSPSMSLEPSIEPSTISSISPSNKPTVIPTLSIAPSAQPSSMPSKCDNEPDWALTVNGKTLYCNTIQSSLCEIYVWFGEFNAKSVNEACCACGGGTHVSDQSPSNLRNPSVSSFPSERPIISSLGERENSITSVHQGLFEVPFEVNNGTSKYEIRIVIFVFASVWVFFL